MKAHIIAIILAILGPSGIYLSLATNPDGALFFLGLTLPILALIISICSHAEKKPIKVAAIVISCLSIAGSLSLFLLGLLSFG